VSHSNNFGLNSAAARGERLSVRGAVMAQHNTMINIPWEALKYKALLTKVQHTEKQRMMVIPVIMDMNRILRR
jgi:hypothetical protein